MTVEKSHGKRRPRTPRPGEHAMTAATVSAGPFKDASTGRFLPGNQAARLGALKRVRSLVTLNPAACAPWVRPFVVRAHTEVLELVAEMGAEGSASLSGFAEDAADAHAMYRALMAIALAEGTDPKVASEARSEARAWMKEHRQSVLSLRAEARAGVPGRDDGPLDLDAELGIVHVATPRKALPSPAVTAPRGADDDTPHHADTPPAAASPQKDPTP